MSDMKEMFEDRKELIIRQVCISYGYSHETLVAFLIWSKACCQ